ncbi:hypothetical protein F4780DRAFT_666621 [Xylariomycetidae sp. FL0641]|nr:hypothetical protein F4780DRAFT_666621 [Xylariomycetidae sp. FL0641]
MRLSQPVCVLCRQRAVAAAASSSSARPPVPASAFSTTSTSSASKNNLRAEPKGEWKEILRKKGVLDTLEVVTEPRKPDQSKPPRHTFDGKRRGPSKVLSAYTPLATQQEASDRADALFMRVVAAETEKAASKASADPGSFDLALVQAISNLYSMLERKDSTADCYTLYTSEIYPAFKRRNEGMHIPKVFWMVVPQLLKRVVVAKQEDMQDERLPSVPEIFSAYAEVGGRWPVQWWYLVSAQIEAIINMGVPPPDSAASKKREDMLNDLVKTWQFLSDKKRTPNPEPPSFDFPHISEWMIKNKLEKKSKIWCFEYLWPSMDNDLAMVALLAIASTALLTDGQPSSLQPESRASPLVKSVIHFVRHTKLDSREVRDAFGTRFPGLRDYTLSVWKRFLDRVKFNVMASDPPIPDEFDPARIHRDVMRVQEEGRLDGRAELDRLWRELLGPGGEITHERAVVLREHPDLIDAFLSARMSLKQNKEAMAVWGLMSKIQLKPTLKSWTIILDGCKRNRNVHGIKSLWRKLQQTGLALDKEVWTTRISGLFECGDFLAGFQALEELASCWQQRGTARKHANAVEPTIEPVNAALASLVKLRQMPAAEKLLAWAGKMGLAPNIYTYNLLLKSFVREGREEDVGSLLASMKKAGVVADPATFVILLGSAVRDSGEEQVETVRRLLTDMTAAGLELNMVTYGKMCSLLLQARAYDALVALAKQLQQEHRQLPPHINTMLLEAYFSCSPPDLQAARDLLNLQGQDRVFYDRAIQGFAEAGETDTALDLYHRVANAGTLVNLGTQATLLSELLAQNRLQDARTLVDTTHKNFLRDYPAFDDWPRFWSHHFWRLAEKNGLIDAETLKSSAARRHEEAPSNALAH